MLHRGISIGNVLVTEDEKEGYLIDLDHAIKVDREGASGAKGRTGTKVFMSIGLLPQAALRAIVKDRTVSWAT